jgi:porin
MLNDNVYIIGGFAVDWSETNEVALRDKDTQFITEIYYKITVNEYINITPNIQYIKNLVLLFDSDTWLVGISASVAI